MEQKQTDRSFPVGKAELIFGIFIVCISLLLVNCIFFGGFNLGFAIAYGLCVLCSTIYLLCSGRKPGLYSILLLLLSLVISASFARSDDHLVKFVMVCFLFVSTNLGLALLAGKNRFPTGGIRSLMDAFSAFFGLGVGELPASSRGINIAFRRSGTIGQKSSAILLGLGIAAPVLLIIIPLLIQADAAFEGMLRYLPEFSIGEFIVTVLFGGCLAFVLYTRNAALRHMEVRALPEKARKGMSALTINTLLITVCLVYCAYLVSQLAYFTGGFAGVLPEDYTLAQYARRGFFEMAWLCAINLSVIIFCLFLCKKEAAPMFTRILCLFVGIVTLFFVATASAKMILYIESFGLTRLRVLTQVIMVFLGIVTVLVSVWLFVPKLPYMKAVLITALVIGAAVSWADVDTQVAKYNVDAYLSGKTDTVDVEYLNSLGDGAVPYLAKLAAQYNVYEHEDIAETADFYLVNRWRNEPEDFRSWNYVNHTAVNILGDPLTADASQYTVFEITFPNPVSENLYDDHGGFHGDGLRFGSAVFSDTDAEKISSQMAGSDVWTELPLSSDLHKLLYGYHDTNTTFHSLLLPENYDMPQVKNGYYFFLDRHSESLDTHDPSGIFDRASYNLTLALFDTDTNTLYFWELDT